MTDFAKRARLKLGLLALLLVLAWSLAAPAGLQPQDRALWDKVNAAQEHMVRWREQNGSPAAAEDDRWGCGLIGLEWSGLTTTLGSLEAKRTACNPSWAVQFTRWYRDQGLRGGDTVAIYSSASFPGLLLAALAAAESMDLEPFVIVSLGASTWGANHPAAPWPAMAAELRRAGFLSHRADYYTLGGGGENGGGLAPEAVTLLLDSAAANGVELLRADGLETMIALKSSLLEQSDSKLLVSIGGSQANLGDDPDVLRLAPGLHRPGVSGHEGNGVIAHALAHGIPVIHALNLRELSARAGIPFDARPARRAPLAFRPAWAFAGLALFFATVLTHRRWRLV